MNKGHYFLIIFILMLIMFLVELLIVENYEPKIAGTTTFSGAGEFDYEDQWMIKQ